MKYQELVDYIYQRHSGNIKLGLERMQAILQSMGNPEKKLNGIHIAGTNGKGSTAAMSEALCLSHNISTGLNTSPHLVDYRERFRINGQKILLQELEDAYLIWQSVFEKYEASFFEITTALAFYLFEQKKLETSIFEVGLGGRLDGTNPFTSTVTAITSISYDHTKSLGVSIEKIAFEKAGILKSKVPLVLGQLPLVAQEVIEEIARELEVPVSKLGRDFFIENIHMDADGTKFDYIGNDLILRDLSLNLLGRHQTINAAVAITVFHRYMNIRKKKIIPDNIREALMNVNWPGRMQIIAHKPTVIVDGAHNEEGMKQLKENLIKLFPSRRIFIVIAILRDKNLHQIIRDVCEVSYKIFISKNHSQRAAEIEEQLEIAKKFHNNIEVIHDVNEATQKAISQANQDDIIIITGSLYTISEVLKSAQQETL
jgi:dihydrofolate synthase/folylpolyglutamate synthase